MGRVARLTDQYDRHPRWQNERNVVDIWLNTHDEGMRITEQDREFARAIDAVENSASIQNMANIGAKKTTKLTEVQLYADGGSRGNPGPSASGYVLLNMSGEVVLRQGEYIGVTTNNQAEYQALKLGLEHALHDFGAREIHVYMDSMLVINQMKHIFKIKNRDLWPIHDACQQLAKQFRKISFDHVPRELNRPADAEVNKALDRMLQEQ